MSLNIGIDSEEEDDVDERIVKVLDRWEVIAVEGKGLYIRGDESPWKIVSEERLERRDDELSWTYESAIGE